MAVDTLPVPASELARLRACETAAASLSPDELITRVAGYDLEVEADPAAPDEYVVSERWTTEGLRALLARREHLEPILAAAAGEGRILAAAAGEGRILDDRRLRAAGKRVVALFDEYAEVELPSAMCDAIAELAAAIDLARATGHTPSPPPAEHDPARAAVSHIRTALRISAVCHAALQGLDVECSNDIAQTIGLELQTALQEALDELERVGSAGSARDPQQATGGAS